MVNILKFRYLYDLQVNGIMFVDFVYRSHHSKLLGLFDYHNKGYDLNTRHTKWPKPTTIHGWISQEEPRLINLDAEIKTAKAKETSKDKLHISKGTNNPSPYN